MYSFSQAELSRNSLYSFSQEELSGIIALIVSSVISTILGLYISDRNLKKTRNYVYLDETIYLLESLVTKFERFIKINISDITFNNERDELLGLVGQCTRRLQRLKLNKEYRVDIRQLVSKHTENKECYKKLATLKDTERQKLVDELEDAINKIICILNPNLSSSIKRPKQLLFKKTC